MHAHQRCARYLFPPPGVSPSDTSQAHQRVVGWVASTSDSVSDHGRQGRWETHSTADLHRGRADMAILQPTRLMSTSPMAAGHETVRAAAEARGFADGAWSRDRNQPLLSVSAPVPRESPPTAQRPPGRLWDLLGWVRPQSTRGESLAATPPCAMGYRPPISCGQGEPRTELKSKVRTEPIPKPCL